MTKLNDTLKIVEQKKDTYYVSPPKGAVTTVRFDLETQVVEVCCRRDTYGSCRLEVRGDGGIKIVPTGRKMIYVEPV